MEMPTFVQVLDFIGTFAFAISGIRLASAKRFDWFGAYVVGVTTAIGGGTMRDIMLGVSPFWMTNPFYLSCSAIALLWVIVFRKLLVRQNNTWFLFDTIGLALFTVTGLEKTLTCTTADGGAYPFWAAHYNGRRSPRYRGKWVLWQYTDQGTVSGVQGPVDLNVFNGKIQDLRALCLP